LHRHATEIPGPVIVNCDKSDTRLILRLQVRAVEPVEKGELMNRYEMMLTLIFVLLLIVAIRRQ